MSRILVVDDEAPLRTLIARTLEASGHHILQAEDGAAAYKVICELYGDLDIVITDIQMPRMNGCQLVQRCVIEFPDLKILCISVYTDSLSPSGHYFLAKPFTPTALRAMVEKVLGVGKPICQRPSFRSPTECDLRAKLVAAEAKLEAANDEYHRFMALQRDAGATEDGMTALRQAITVRRAAMAEYTEVLREFTEFSFGAFAAIPSRQGNW